MLRISNARVKQELAALGYVEALEDEQAPEQEPETPPTGAVRQNPSPVSRKFCRGESIRLARDVISLRPG